MHVKKITREGFVIMPDSLGVPLARRKRLEFLHLLKHLWPDFFSPSITVNSYFITDSSKGATRGRIYIDPTILFAEHYQVKTK